jgi:hypothetical protein
VSSDSLALIELLLVFGVVIGWAGWQLWSVKRPLREDRQPRKEERESDSA